MTKTYEYFCKSGMRKRKLKTYVALVNADRAARRKRGMGGVPDAEDPRTPMISSTRSSN
jgi:hypothetical protein